MTFLFRKSSNKNEKMEDSLNLVRAANIGQCKALNKLTEAVSNQLDWKLSSVSARPGVLLLNR